MVLEQEPPRRHNPLELLKGRTYVVAETFFIGNGSSDETVEEEVRSRLSNQGVTDTVEVTLCNSEEERIKEIINSLKNQKVQRASDDPWMGIAGFNADELQEIFNAISVMIIEKDPILEGIDGTNITILQLNAPSSSTVTDIGTGLKIAAIKKGEHAYPMHPTPAH